MGLKIVGLVYIGTPRNIIEFKGCICCSKEYGHTFTSHTTKYEIDSSPRKVLVDLQICFRSMVRLGS